ncbi:MAG: RtcB family protein [Planctomycetota bacterium]
MTQDASEVHDVVIARWTPEPLSAGVAATLQRLARTDGVARIAVMPDVHEAGDVCVGTVIAAKDRVYPAAIGGDIGCGMTAVRLHGAGERLREHGVSARVLEGLAAMVPTNRHGRRSAVTALPEELLGQPLSTPRLQRLLARDGRVQWGTLGRGNHFLELQRDREAQLWLLVHSGSRAMGQAILKEHLPLCEKTNTGLPSLRAESAAARAYLADHNWALVYADSSRRRMALAAALLLEELLGVVLDESSWISSPHNFIRREVSAGVSYFVHRKGANSAAVDELGVIPGSMATPSYHVRGRGCERALCSSSHGAGRLMSRSEARRRMTARAFRQALDSVYYDVSRGRALWDEAPQAYKDIRKVMRAQSELVRIERVLSPVLSYKGR